MSHSVPLDTTCRVVKEQLDNRHDFLLLDCREQQEYDLAKIPGATLIPMSQIQARLSELTPHKTRHIVVHCHHGGRSRQVALWLRGQGFENVQNMAGGIDHWSQEIDPTIPRY